MSEAGLHRLATDSDDGLVVVISGPSGVGKTTLTRAVERSIPGAVFSVSCTTRKKAEKDVDGVDYRFVTDEEFERMKSAGEFLETAGVYGRKYGTPKAWVLEQLRRGRVVILEIDVQGAAQVKRQIPGVFGVFVLPPDEATLLQRLRDRARDDEATIQQRYSQARNEIAAARNAGVYDLFLINSHLDEATRAAIEAVTQARRQAGARRRKEHG